MIDFINCIGLPSEASFARLFVQAITSRLSNFSASRLKRAACMDVSLSSALIPCLFAMISTLNDLSLLC